MDNNDSKKIKRQNSAGFTLIELIIVIAIMSLLVGVVAAVAIPYVKKARRAKTKQKIEAIYEIMVNDYLDDGAYSGSYIPTTIPDTSRTVMIKVKKKKKTITRESTASDYNFSWTDGSGASGTYEIEDAITVTAKSSGPNPLDPTDKSQALENATGYPYIRVEFSDGEVFMETFNGVKTK